MTWMALVRSPCKIDVNSRKLRLQMAQESVQSWATEIVETGRAIIYDKIEIHRPLIVASGCRIDRYQGPEIGASFCRISKPKQNWIVADRGARKKIVDRETFAIAECEDRDGFFAGGSS